MKLKNLTQINTDNKKIEYNFKNPLSIVYMSV